MNFSLASSSSQPQCCASECMQHTCASFPLSRPPVSISCLIKKNNMQAIRSGARRRAISSQLIPNHIEESYKRNKHLQLPIKKLDFVRTLLIDNYDSYTYNIYQALSVVNGVAPVVVQNDDLTWEELCYYLYEENAFDNIVISPGPGSPACPKDIGICLELLHKCSDIPILGVCLGHQALGLVHGAQVVHAPEPIHGRLSELEHNGCELFHEIPSGRNSGFKGGISILRVLHSPFLFRHSYPENQNYTGRRYVKWNPLLKDISNVTLLVIADGHLKIIFEVVRYHSLAIDPESLPPELIPIAWTDSAGTLLRSTNNTKPSEALTKGTIFSDSVSAEVDNRSSNLSSHYDLTRRTRVLMGIKHSRRPHYGLQFHPESIATSHGIQIFKNFREITYDYWLRFGSSYNKGKYAHSAVNFLYSSQLAREVHSSVNPESNAVNQQNKESPRDIHLMHDTAETDASEMSNMVNHNHASIAYKRLKLKWRKFDHLASQVGGAKNIFCELFGRHKAENSFWLDSSSTEKGRARFSFMGAKGGSLWKQLSFRLSDQRNGSLQGGGFMSIEDGEGFTKSMFLENGFFDFLNKELQSFRYSEKDSEGLPFDFHGGYIGYIGYDLKLECGDTSNQHKSRTPDACFFFADNLIAIDHLNDDVYILCIHDGRQTKTPWLDDTEEKLMNLKNSVTREMRSQESPVSTFSPFKAGFVAEKSRKEYIDDVNKCLNYIKDGESYELCLTTQIRKTIKELNSVGLYLHLRERNPAPYAAWLNFSNEDLCICCSSPERFLKLDRNGILEAKPIKGTIARGATEEDDERLRLKLKFSEKDQAENLMIVDLLRNDLGRVCEPGSVHVPRLMDVESYATVHTMVSTIRGKKLSHVSAIDCVKAAFPGGSMTGAPKLRSMKLLDSLETCSRGIYSGCIGFFSYDQTFDLNIVIRTVIIHEGEASIGAGGAIVALSNPEDEYEEMILKTQAPAKAVIHFE